MLANWYFSRFKPGDQQNDPISHALFAQDEVGDVASSLVREAIQNSLDASEARQVKVVFTLRRRRAPSFAAIEPCFAGLWDHLEAPRNGLSEAPARGGSVPLLAIEDFGTSGLVGNPQQWDPLEGGTNGFFLFFHATGRSGKSGEARGRWGVGKYVFPLASAANCWFGLTVPIDVRRRLLMGRIVLKTHRAANATYHPDGRWGEADGSGFVSPISSDTNLLDRFAETCSLRRGEVPGLSVVVPWIRPEVTASAIYHAVVREYFLPLLRDELIVEIDDDGDVERLDAETLVSAATRLDDPVLVATIALAQYAVAHPETLIACNGLADETGSPKWSPDLLSDQQRELLAARLDSGAPIGIRFAVPVSPRKGARARSFFDVYLQSVSDAGRVSPLVVREGITVPKARASQIADMIALVVVDDPPLAGLIGDSENPAHTEMLHQLIKEKYYYARPTLDLVRQTPANLLRAIRHGDVDDDPFLLSDLFPTLDGGSGPSARPKPKRGERTAAPNPTPEPSPRRFRIDRIDGGFSIVGVANAQQVPAELTATCAYEVRRGSPLKQYSPLDFSFGDNSLPILTEQASVISAEANKLRIRPEAGDFRIEVRGFDRYRDLYVRVDAS